MKKKKSKKGLWKKAIVEFNKWVRTKDVPGEEKFDGHSNTCITCKKRFPMANLHAGHFFHGKLWKSAMDERNVWPQCVTCNKWKHGSLIEYSEFIRDLYGQHIVAELHALRYEAWNPSREELEAIIKKYANKVQKKRV